MVDIQVGRGVDYPLHPGAFQVRTVQHHAQIRLTGGRAQHLPAAFDEAQRGRHAVRQHHLHLLAGFLQRQPQPGDRS